jgi:Helix-turn-helix domain
MGKLRLSAKERRRVEVLTKVKRGDIPLTKAAELLGVCYRQVLRIWQRYDLEGNAGLKHGLRDQPSNRQIDVSRRERVLELYQAKYGDFGPTLAVEYLRKCDGEELSEETFRRWLMAAGLWQPRRQGARHRQWRERRGHWGEMVQMDGSDHDWFEGRRERASLMVMIDDATNWTHAKFYESETTAAAMSVFWEYVEHYGLPRSLYVDRASIYETTRDSTVEEALKDASPLTQFGRAMKELEVELILAHSPQAKGRVERRHGVFQDRFVKALRLKKSATLEEANAYLEGEFLGELNKRFSVAARFAADLHRSVARGVKLAHVLSYQEERVVQNDWTVSWCNRIFQLDERHQKLSLARKKILVSELLDGSIRLTSRGESLRWTELPERPATKAKTRKPEGKKDPYKPAANHPWRGVAKGGEKI